MNRSWIWSIGLGIAVIAHAQTDDVTLPELAVYSPRIANQTPVATFAMPVSALRFEPRVDLQTRNFAESQADVTIRGGIFENSGFKIGAVTLFDPQTGHYFAEIPVAPAMLTAPEVLTGVDNATGSTNASVGTVAYGWRRIRTAGTAAVGVGQYGLAEAEAYQGYVSDQQLGGQRLAADVAWAHSEANGSVPNGDHQLDRVDARVQLAGENSQTDLFVGYQEKFFGWPNLYTPFNSPESENLKTLLVALNSRLDLGGGDFVQLGAYYRRNRDDYAFNRFTQVGHPYNHVTWVQGAALDGRRDLGLFVLNFRGELLADELHSTSLTFGPYRTRTLVKGSVVPEKTWTLTDGSRLIAKAGAAYDDSNRLGGAVSPVVELARENAASTVNRIYVSYSETTQVPTYTALDSNSHAGLFRGNPNLGREESHNFEVGARGSVAGWSTQAAAFYRRDDGLVDWTFRKGVTARSANLVDIATSGVEVVATHSWKRIDVVFGYTWLSKDSDYRGATVDASFYALNYARHRFTAALTARLTSELTLRMDNVARVQTPNFLRTTGGDDAIISSLGLAYRPMAVRRLELSVQADNLWNSSFQEIPAVPAARRQISGRVAYAW
jgi:hypothetical protein